MSIFRYLYRKSLRKFLRGLPEDQCEEIIRQALANISEWDAFRFMLSWSLFRFFRAFWKGIATAPWASVTVSTVVRIGAGFIVLMSILAICGGIIVMYNEPVVATKEPSAWSFNSIFNLFLMLYVWAVFLRVAISGRAPGGWIPWR